MRHEEDRLQMMCVRWFSLQYPRMARLLHHSPNGGWRTRAEAALFKAMGTRAGFPDLILLVPRGGFHALMIEMKTRRGRQSEEQREYQRLVEVMGYRYEVCRSFDGFRDIIEDYLKASSTENWPC